jgi:hypothetical protein
LAEAVATARSSPCAPQIDADAFDRLSRCRSAGLAERESAATLLFAFEIPIEFENESPLMAEILDPTLDPTSHYTL